MTISSETKLAFSDKYDDKHAKAYFDKHQAGIWRNLSNWRDHQVARKALKLAGDPQTILDVPCGTGRFWSLLAEQPLRQIYASDYSQQMIDTGMHYRDKSVTSRIKAFQASAFDIDAPDNFVDSIFCIRLIHHIGEKQDRLTLLKEFHRVTKSTVIISLWVDGNFKAWRRRKLEQKRSSRDYQNRFIIDRKTIEEEFEQSGFRVKASLDFLPKYAMWRTYVLEKI
ncbi:MAG TPA: class I SAM-dependent methyltransferase [Methylophaga aminisulfidivorans]|uniref:Class I SAM-dependent methyltransferase n=2 Tax=root TaxID=1 RepID=A0A7C1VNM2_9GAMM|nr:class I SAM-dependent methyltransferase [Methylophaga aminisulfidivorans]